MMLGRGAAAHDSGNDRLFRVMTAAKARGDHHDDPRGLPGTFDAFNDPNDHR